MDRPILPDLTEYLAAEETRRGRPIAVMTLRPHLYDQLLEEMLAQLGAGPGTRLPVDEILINVGKGATTIKRLEIP
jgi:hypothetical protein